MKKHNHLLWILATATVSLYACSSDSISTENPGDSQTPDNNPGTSTETPDEPTTAGLGETCNDKTILCASGLKCVNNKCVDPDSLPQCSDDIPCKEDYICINALCLEQKQPGDNCDETNICSNAECLNGTCTVIVSEGASCKDSYTVCADGFICDPNNDVCIVPSALGEQCDDIDVFCADGLFCHYEQMVCVKSAAEGEECGQHQICSHNLECDNGICKKTASIGNTCDKNTFCLDGGICFENKCITKRECQDDNACEADTYCCTEDTCDIKNVCVAYGSGPRDSVNDTCTYQTEPGLFEADIQCEWLAPAANDPYPKSNSVVTPIMVSKTPHDTGDSNAVIFATYIPGDWSNADEAYKYGVIRILNPETCELLENIYDKNHYVTAGAAMAIGDVDNDGIVEIFAGRSPYQPQNTKEPTGGVVKFKWSKEENKYVTDWAATTILAGKAMDWGGLALHDINDDGIPELITPYAEVLNARTGEKLNGKQYISRLSYTNRTTNTFSRNKFATVGDFDNDGKIEYASTGGANYADYNGTVKKVKDGYNFGPDVFEWQIVKDENGNIVSQSWVPEYTIDSEPNEHYALKAIGDFGTVGDAPESFDWSKKDGIAEIVSTSGIEAGKGSAQFAIHALKTIENPDGTKTKTLQRVLYMNGLYGGGAPTVGDFDGDSMPEVGVAFGDYYRVIDPRCRKNSEGKLPPECDQNEEFVLWKMKNQDDSSFTTGSSVFDFDGDGQIEVVYADECYTRIYNGKTGEVLFSSKQSSRTAYEMPTIADVDNDQSAEILMGANALDRTCSAYDKTHKGIRCKSNNDCTSKRCEDNYCRCNVDNDCNWRKGADGKIKQEYTCMAPMEGETNTNKVCRALRKTDKPITGIRIMRDRYDRWASSRNIWNQFDYSITNVNDEMTIPKTVNWIQNFLTNGLNNYRANSQGKLGMNAAPDITGKLNNTNLCAIKDGQITLSGVICNRGTKMVASKMPASFYKINDDGSQGDKYCTAYTAANVPVGGCLAVSCTLPGDQMQEGTRIRMISNDDGEGGRTTVECNDNNNADEIRLEQCTIN